MKAEKKTLEFRKPSEIELDLIGLVLSEGGWMNHDDTRLAPYCDDPGAITNHNEPDIFNRCHEMGWLATKHDHDTSSSTVGITRDGRVAYYAARPAV